MILQKMTTEIVKPRFDNKKSHQWRILVQLKKSEKEEKAAGQAFLATVNFDVKDQFFPHVVTSMLLYHYYAIMSRCSHCRHNNIYDALCRCVNFFNEQWEGRWPHG